jgi:hypothetical protein
MLEKGQTENHLDSAQTLAPQNNKKAGTEETLFSETSSVNPAFTNTSDTARESG